MDEHYNYIVDELADKGWVVVPEFMPLEQIKILLNEQKALLRQGQFKNAGIGRGDAFQVRPEIRGDQVLWLDDDNLSDTQNEYLQKIDALRQIFNREFFLGLKSFECHFTQYPPKTFYKKHIDQFSQTSERVISCLLYLNLNWKEEFGGQLRIYSPEGNQEVYHDITPHAGTFVCFRSENIPHEVLPTHKERYSITGWLRR